MPSEISQKAKIMVSMLIVLSTWLSNIWSQECSIALSQGNEPAKSVMLIITFTYYVYNTTGLLCLPVTLLFCWNCKLPYTAKLSSGKTFAVFGGFSLIRECFPVNIYYLSAELSLNVLLVIMHLLRIVPPYLRNME